MKKLLIIAAVGVCVGCTQQGDNLVQYVDPLIGTQIWQSNVSIAGHEDPSGFTFPGVTVPFGMTEWTAHTIENRNLIVHNVNRVPYWYNHSLITGFIGTHYPSGGVLYDYGAIELMPVVGKLLYRSEERASSFSHDNEVAKPDYYSVLLDDYAVQAEMSALHSSSVINFTYPESDSSFVVIDAYPSPFTAGVPAVINIDPTQKEVSGRSVMSSRGYRESGYFVIRFDTEFDGYGTFNQLQTYPEVIESKYLFTTENGKKVNGLTGVYTQDSHIYGPLKQTKVDPVVDYNWDWYRPADDFDYNDYQIEWNGTLVPPVTGEYTMGLHADDGARLYINGELIIDKWESTDFSLYPIRNKITLVGGKEYDIRVEYYQISGGSKIRLSWIIPDERAQKEVAWGSQKLESSTKMGAFINFKTKQGQKVTARVGTSFISVEQARENLEREIANKDIDKIRKENISQWQKELSMIELPEASIEDKTVFYTAMYHAMLVPRNLTEYGRYRSPFDGKVYEGESYSDYALWDTFRAAHPLYVLLKPNFAGRLITGLLNGFDEGGWLPKLPNPGYTNCMIATHGDAVIADAYMKGITNFDIEKAKRAMLQNAYKKGNYMSWGRMGIMEYQQYGYVPIEFFQESVARTLEFAYDDFCIAQFLDKKGDKEEAAKLYERSKAFKNVFDPETKLVRGRKADGSWAHPDDYAISIWSGYNKRGVDTYRMIYTLFAPHNIAAIKEGVGGADSLAHILDRLFDEDRYYVGDEFAMHAPYMYNECGQPWQTQKRVSDIVKNYYLPIPSGLPGNDDLGQMSSWYLFSAMGFYPMCPGRDEYQIGTPAMKKMVVNLENGKKFTIIAENLSDENIYVQSLYLNGVPHTTTVLKHADVANGGELRFNMGAKPNKEWFK
ncbi:GH92 family glycosyl hydrolase [Bacteroides sp.]